MKCCIASKWILVAALLVGAVCGGEARAEGGLALGVRVQQEFYTPLVPVTRNFRTCFHIDVNGDQVMGICTDADQPAAAGPASDAVVPRDRAPAQERGAAPPSLPGSAPSRRALKRR